MLKKTPLKRKQVLLKRSGGIKRKPKSEEIKEIERMTRDVDHRFYTEIWNSRKHNCEQCDRYLGEECKTIYCDHIIEKSKYPVYRYREENIALVCGDCHSLKTNGVLSEWYKNRIKETKEKLGI